MTLSLSARRSGNLGLLRHESCPIGHPTALRLPRLRPWRRRVLASLRAAATASTLLLLNPVPRASVDSADLPSGVPGSADFFQRKSAEYDYDIPKPGSYSLPVIGPATNGTVLNAEGKPVTLHQLMENRVVILSFIYTRCTDPRACLRATGVLSELQQLSARIPGLADKLLLLTLSFDPAHDTPGVMARYGRISQEEGRGADWLFLTTRSAEDLSPLLDAYGQRVQARKKFSPLGPLQHNLRVYLIDPEQQIRNIYSYGLLDPRLVAADVQTLLMEGAASRAGRTARMRLIEIPATQGIHTR